MICRCRLKKGFAVVVTLSMLFVFTGCGARLDMTKAAIVEENLVRNDGKFILNGEFSNYYNLKNEQNENIPILLHVTGDLDSLKIGKVSDKLENLKFDYYGLCGGLDIELIADNSYFYVLNITGQNEQITANSPVEGEAAVAYLKREYDDAVKIVKVSDELISYEVNNEYEPNNYSVLVVIEKDTVSGKISITIQDEADKIRI